MKRKLGRLYERVNAGWMRPRMNWSRFWAVAK